MNQKMPDKCIAPHYMQRTKRVKCLTNLYDLYTVIADIWVHFLAFSKRYWSSTEGLFINDAKQLKTLFSIINIQITKTAP